MPSRPFSSCWPGRLGASLRGAALPAWLHRVAVRIATRLARSRKAIARLAIEPAERASSDPVAEAETLGALDEEVNRLPERFRRAVVLCYLDGLTAAEAARQLGCPTGTVESRLAAARKRLRERLTGRGITLPAGILAVAGQAVLAPEAVARVAGASAAFARGGAIANETTAQLARRVLAMWQTRKWVSVAIIATVLMIGAGMGWASLQDDPPPNTQSATATPTAPAPQTKENPPTATNGWPFAKRIDGIGATLVGISHDSHTLVFVGTHQVYGLDLTEPKGANSLSFHFRIQNPVSDAAVSPDGKYVATAEGVQGVKLRDAATGKVVEAFWPSGKLPAHHVAFSQDGTRLIALGTVYNDARRGPRGDPRNAKSTYEAQISVWNLVTRKEVGYPVESTTVQPGRGDLSYPSYQLVENGHFVLKHESILIPPKADPDEGTARILPLSRESTGFRFSIFDIETGKSGRPVEVKDPNLSISNYLSGSISPDGKTVAALDRAQPGQKPTCLTRLPVRNRYG